MPVYQGETVEVTNNAVDFDGATVLTPTQIATITVEIVDTSLTAVVTTTPMSWDAIRSLWFYMWDTTPVGAGTFQAKIEMTGTDGTVAFAYLTIRLTAPKF